MTVFLLLPYAAGSFSLLVAIVALVRKTPTLATWFFAAGMATLGIDSILTGLVLHARQLNDILFWLRQAFIVKSLEPGLWLCFSLTYSRANYRQFLVSWRIPLVLMSLLPIGLSVGLLRQSFQIVAGSEGSVWRLQLGAIATPLNAVLLIALVLILINLEQTFRSAVGTMRWRIKFVILALVVIFGARFYVRSQSILFSAPDLALWGVESGALLIGCIFLAVAYARTGLSEVDVYPSTAVLRSSFTVLIVGTYLFIVGVAAQVVQRFGGADFFQVQAFIVLLGMAGLAVLLLSDRARQAIHAFVVRHFRKAQHDSVRLWATFSQRLARVTDQEELCSASTKLISETFDVLSVTIWLLEEEKDRLVIGASTAGQRPEASQREVVSASSSAVLSGIRAQLEPLDLELVDETWAEELRRLNPTTFANGGSRLCVPLRAGKQSLGVLVLADRISGVRYSPEELALLKCLADQMTSVLLNLRLGSELAEAKELDAFSTMSTFFVHDLKNAAASLNLMLNNLPVHFDDPAFRQDALRGIGNSARRIDDMIERLTALRQRPESLRVETDLNQLVNDALDKVGKIPNVELTRELQAVPPILADRDQIQSVVTNLVMNAGDAVGSDGRIRVRTEQQGGRALLSVIDNGCGMSHTFVATSLFRPFQSTKKKGLGVGLFQSRAIVQAHGGRMQVESEVGHGTTFLVSFPSKSEP